VIILTEYGHARTMLVQ